MNPPASHIRALVIFAVILTLVLLFAGGYATLFFSGFFAPKIPPAAQPTGALLVSMAAVSSSTGYTLGIGPFTLVVDPEKTSVQPFYDVAPTNPSPTFEYSISADGNYGAFLGVAHSDGPEGFTVYRADLRGSSDHATLMHEFSTAAVAAMPTAADAYRDSPVVSLSGTILYASLPAAIYTTHTETLGTLPAEDWAIYEADATGTPRMLVHGLRPKWVDATHFAFLKNDGVYLYDTVGDTDKKVWSANTGVTIADGFDVSDDASLLAFSEPSAGTLTIVRALNWAGNVFSELATIPSITAANLTFSPDNTFLAMTTQTGTGSALEYYSTVTGKFTSPYPSFESNIKAFYITDWR